MAQLRSDQVEIGPGAFIAHGVRVPHGTIVGAGTNIHRNCVLKGTSPISIGKFCAIAEGVHILSANHEVNRANIQKRLQNELGAGFLDATRGPVEIGNNVWIGDNATVLSGVRVGDGAVIASGAVVTRDVEPFAIVAGLPARSLRKRFNDSVIEELQALAWWDWPPELMLANQDFFRADLTGDRVRIADLIAKD